MKKENNKGVQSKQDPKKETSDWANAKGLMESDKRFLRQIKEYVDEGLYGVAMDIACQGDTEVREAIPGDIWLRMGGTLTNTGMAKLKERGFTLEEINSIIAQAQEDQFE